MVFLFTNPGVTPAQSTATAVTNRVARWRRAAGKARGPELQLTRDRVTRDSRSMEPRVADGACQIIVTVSGAVCVAQVRAIGSGDLHGAGELVEAVHRCEQAPCGMLCLGSRPISNYRARCH